MTLESVPQRGIEVHRVVIPTTRLVLLDDAGILQIHQNPGDAALRNPNQPRNVSHSDLRITRQTQQHVSVVTQIRPPTSKHLGALLRADFLGLRSFRHLTPGHLVRSTTWRSVIVWVVAAQQALQLDPGFVVLEQRLQLREVSRP